jgi:hypothetical protein
MRGTGNMLVEGVIDAEGRGIANCGIDGASNARLIAAAPDLLAVLQDVLSTWDSGSEAFPISDIRAAIIKAKGQL